MKRILFLIFLLPMATFALQCPIGGPSGERFFSVKILPEKVICYYDNNVQRTLDGKFKPTKPRFWYWDVVDSGYMCLGHLNCHFVPTTSR